MKKLVTFIALITLSTTSLAGFQGNSTSSQKMSNVAQAKKAYDDSPIVLRGYIVKKVGDEKYLFKDRSGQIYVEIDDDIWGGLTVSPKDKVTIYGTVDKEKGKIEIDVKRISK
ncbi:MAG: NirD/YgiW/YdeI family stress tolerance protein [Pasteurellaceae bacterium]|nr:NirD/YgiW/YdeI family stress tolerance protein [Pasteurellaceae bacterium]